MAVKHLWEDFYFPLFWLGKIQVCFLHVATWIADGWPSPVVCTIYGASSVLWYGLSTKGNTVCRLKCIGTYMTDRQLDRKRESERESFHFYELTKFIHSNILFIVWNSIISEHHVCESLLLVDYPFRPGRRPMLSWAPFEATDCHHLIDFGC